jgi:uncharacterized protein YaeQ
MALTATIHHFTIRLSDVDRGVYETLELKAAKHPSESDEYLVAAFSRIASSTPRASPSRVGCRSPTSRRSRCAISPARSRPGSRSARRMPRACTRRRKAAPRVAVYTHKDPAQLLRSLERERIHRAEALELYSLGRELVAALVERLARRNDLDLSVTDRHLYVTIGGETLSGEVERLSPHDRHRAPKLDSLSAERRNSILFVAEITRRDFTHGGTTAAALDSGSLRGKKMSAKHACCSFAAARGHRARRRHARPCPGPGDRPGVVADQSGDGDQRQGPVRRVQRLSRAHQLAGRRQRPQGELVNKDDGVQAPKMIELTKEFAADKNVVALAAYQNTGGMAALAKENTVAELGFAMIAPFQGDKAIVGAPNWYPFRSGYPDEVAAMVKEAAFQQKKARRHRLPERDLRADDREAREGARGEAEREHRPRGHGGERQDRQDRRLGEAAGLAIAKADPDAILLLVGGRSCAAHREGDQGNPRRRTRRSTPCPSCPPRKRSRSPATRRAAS